MTESTDINELAEKEPWLKSTKLVVKPDMLFGKRGKSGLVALNLDLAQVANFVKERLGKEVVQIFTYLGPLDDIVKNQVYCLFYMDYLTYSVLVLDHLLTFIFTLTGGDERMQRSHHDLHC